MEKLTKKELAEKFNMSPEQVFAQSSFPFVFEEKEKNNESAPSPEVNEIPSKVTDEYWVFAVSKKLPKYEWYAIAEGGFVSNRFLEALKHKNSGKWLIFVDNKELDRTWKKVKEATEKGILGGHSKASTAMPNPNSISDDEGVICVYTNDWKNIEDVNRIKKALRSIGIKTTLYYKTDQDTGKDRYKVKGAKNISKYISRETDETKRFDIASLNGINKGKIELLKKIGIEDYDDLFAFDTSQKLKKSGITTQYIEKLKLYALSQKENKVYKVGNYSIPKGEIVYFDIETDLASSYDDKRIWSIAIYHRNKAKSFIAKTFLIF